MGGVGGSNEGVGLRPTAVGGVEVPEPAFGVPVVVSTGAVLPLAGVAPEDEVGSPAGGDLGLAVRSVLVGLGAPSRLAGGADDGALVVGQVVPPLVAGHLRQLSDLVVDA